MDPRPACASETVSKTVIIQWPSAFSPPCRIRVMASPVACTVPGFLSLNVFQQEGRMLAILVPVFCSSASTLSKNIRRSCQKSGKNQEKSRPVVVPGASWGRPGSLQQIKTYKWRPKSDESRIRLLPWGPQVTPKSALRSPKTCKSTAKAALQATQRQRTRSFSGLFGKCEIC